MRCIPKVAFLFLLLLCACQTRRHKNEGQTPSVGMTEKEEQLLQWEQRLKQKESELAELQHQIDSSIKQMDSLSVYNPALVGNWHMRMECIETDCEGSAIGDLKTEQWNIAYERNLIIARAYTNTNKQLIRIYRGWYQSDGLQLSDSAYAGKAKISVHLQPTKKNRMEGIREVIQPNCKIVYSLVVERLK